MRLNKNFYILVLLFIVANKLVLAQENVEKLVLIKTTYGVMKAKLYNETPQHRDNFLKLVGEGYYNDLLFHRVIKDFMIQGGDPDSRGADATKRLGSGGPSYQIPAEFVEGYFHKKGALSAARMGDNVNPEKKSSGSQFYIVQGKVFTNEQLLQFEEKQKFQKIRTEALKLYNNRIAEVQRLQAEGKTDSIEAIQLAIQKEVTYQIDSMYTPIFEERRKIYSTLGGTPHLDGGYTVFGEVFEGLNIIDSIANVQTAPGDRPLKDIIMSIEILK